MTHDSPIIPLAAIADPVRRAPVPRKVCVVCGERYVWTQCPECAARYNRGYPALARKFAKCKSETAF